MNKFKPIKEAEKIENDYKKTIPAKAQKKRNQGFGPMFSPSYFNKKKEEFEKREKAIKSIES